MRWWTKFFDTFFGPSLSMIGWNIFVGPMVRQKDPEELRKAIERIPLKERRDAWSTAIYNRFTEEQMAESRRRVEFGIRIFEQAMKNRPYVAGPTYSLGDINIFCMAYALPVMWPDHVNNEKTPGIIAWLRRIYPRPAISQSFKLGRTPLAERAREVVDKLGVAA
jgi:glutathione S-transferase/GST-like protein